MAPSPIPPPSGRQSRMDVNELPAVELDSLPPSEQSQPPAESDALQRPATADIVALARNGNLAEIQALISTRAIDVHFADSEGATLLHWAAINNQYELSKYLIGAGADVNALGGPALATPALWATKRNAYYIIKLLIDNGADTAIVDNKGYSVLHSAAIEGFDYLALMLLLSGQDPNIADGQGQTPLMWAAYRGNPSTVRLLLRWGAFADAQDNNGFTALHWSIISGYFGCSKVLLEHGADRLIASQAGRTPFDAAKDSGREKGWLKVLDRAGYLPNGDVRLFRFPFIKSEQALYLALFCFLPFPAIIIFALTLAHLPVYASVPICIGNGALFYLLVNYLLERAPLDIKQLDRTPFLSGVFTACLFWVALCFLFRVAPVTLFNNPFLTIFTLTLIGLCAHFYYVTMCGDPGFVPLESGRTSQRRILNELLQQSKFDSAHICLECMIKRPLRSKHCSTCKRCVSKFDHHCPWLDTCVGAGNHRTFILFVIFLWMGLASVLYITYLYILALPSLGPEIEETCLLLPGIYCDLASRDKVTSTLIYAVCSQVVWVTMLMLVQLWQVSRAITTIEGMRGFYHSSSAGGIEEIFGPMPTSVSAALQSDANQRDLANKADSPGCWNSCKRLFGLDVFYATAIHSADAEYKARQESNPYSRGFITNCTDFWMAPGPVFRRLRPPSGAKDNNGGHPSGRINLLDGEPVNYAEFYQAPIKPRRGWFSRRGGYDPIATEV